MRYRLYLRQRYKALLSYTGLLTASTSLLVLAPLGILPFYPEEAPYAGGFVLAGIALFIPSVILWRLLAPREPIGVTIHEGMVVVLIVWAAAISFGAIPFMTAINLTFTQAVFETTSGLTTTGLSVVDVLDAPRIILLYRSLLQMAGGAGFVIIALSAVAGPVGAGLTAAEGRTEQLAPHVRQSAGIVIRIYLVYNIIGILGLKLAGMGWFDAINHALCAVATGGFSTRPESIGYWDSTVIEVIIMGLMLLGALNFLTAYTLLKGKFNAVRHNGEIRLTIAVLPACALLILVTTTASLYPSLHRATRGALFEATSALTGTGYGISNYLQWSDFSWLVLICLMIIGGGSSSTAGGLKQYRVYVLYKALIWEFRRAFMPRHTINEPAIWTGEQRGFLSDNLVRRVTLFVFIYLIAFVIGTGLIALHGFPLGESLFEFASALGTVGMSVGVTSAESPLTLLWTQTAGMFLGRLEFFAIIIGAVKLSVDLRAMIFARNDEHHA